jgi:Family of unknown function (DUF6169)
MYKPYIFIKNTAKTQYSFLTNAGIIYRIDFSEIPDLFADYPLFANNVFEFIIALDKSQKNLSPSFDNNVGITIAKIVKDFLDEREKIIVYFCDVKDRRHEARNRRFNFWFNRFNDADFINFTIPIKDTEVDVVYYNTIILKQENPYKIQIFEAFESIIDDFNEK